MKAEADRLERDKTSLTTERNDARKQRDHFKVEYEETEASVIKRRV